MTNYNPHKGWIRSDGSAFFGGENMSNQEAFYCGRRQVSSNSFHAPDNTNSSHPGNTTGF